MIHEDYLNITEQNASDREGVEDIGRGSMAVDHQSNYSPWDLVDVIGSPTLTGLIGALTIQEFEDCEDISFLDPSSPATEDDEDSCDPMMLCNFQNSTANQGADMPFFSVVGAWKSRLSRSTQTRRASRVLDSSPHNELSPFPASRKILLDTTCRKYPFLSENLRMTVTECENNLLMLEKIHRNEIQRLVDSMWDIAVDAKYSGEWQKAERWWRHVVATNRKSQDTDHSKL